MISARLRLARERSGDEIAEVGRRPGVDERDDVRMREASEALGLAAKLRLHAFVASVPSHLQRDSTRVLEVVGLEDEPMLALV